MADIYKLDIYSLRSHEYDFMYSLSEGTGSALIDEVFDGKKLCEKRLKDVTFRFQIWVVVHSIDEFLSGQRIQKDFEIHETPKDGYVYLNKSAVYPFSQQLLLNEHNTINSSTENIPLPIVHLVPTSIFVDSLFGSCSLTSFVPRLYQIMDNSIWNYLIPIVPFLYPDYIVPDGNKEGEDYVVGKNGIKRGKGKLKMLLKKAIGEISSNFENNLYKLEISQEYADLNARLAGESFLSGGHASGVAPFIFHSERAIERLIHKEFKSYNDIYSGSDISALDRIKKQSWRILLVDDKAKDELQPKSCGVTKLKVITHLFEEIFEGVAVKSRKYNKGEMIEEKDRKILLIEYAETISEAEDALRKRKYDIILLDYLLEKEERQYGYELLEHIFNYTEAKKIFKDCPQNKLIDAIKGQYVSPKFEEFLIYLRSSFRNNKQNLSVVIDKIIKEIESVDQKINSTKNEKRRDDLQTEKAKLVVALYDYIGRQFEKDEYQIGPHERLFFMFISAYTSAVYERLLSEGLNRSEKYWHIAVGACPTNTPQLFLYNLLKLMEKQLEDSGVDKLSAKGIYDVVNTIYGETDKVRSRANEKYQDVLDLHYLYRKMLKDVEIPQDSIFNTKGSVLITNFITKNVNLGGLLEHLTQLVHLTAFGTVRQWPEMWEEYIYFKSQFDLKLFKEEIGENADRLFYELCVKIESYILKLKSDIR